MRFATTVAIVSALVLLQQVSANLTEQEKLAYKEKQPPGEIDYCQPCLQKAMNNHFPHACAADMNSDEANGRPGGATEEEDRCVCIAFQNHSWMKADCSFECNYVHNEKAMKYFLTSDKMPGCDKWIDFSTGQEKLIEGFTPKDPNYVPEVYEQAPPPPPLAEGEEGADGRVPISVHIEHDEAKAAQMELEGKLPLGSAKGIKDHEEKKKADAAAEPEIKKDEL